jgi:hypothetical protein
VASFFGFDHSPVKIQRNRPMLVSYAVAGSVNVTPCSVAQA